MSFTILAGGQDHGQQVVEVVGDAARKPADAFQLLCVVKLLLRQALLRHVPGVHHDSLHRRVVQKAAPRCLDPMPASVLVSKVAGDTPKGSGCSNDAPEHLDDTLLVVGVHVGEHRRSSDLIAPPAKLLGHAWTDELEVSLGVENEDHVGCMLDERSKSFLAVLECLRHALLLGDDIEHRHEVVHLGAVDGDGEPHLERLDVRFDSLRAPRERHVAVRVQQIRVGLSNPRDNFRHLLSGHVLQASQGLEGCIDFQEDEVVRGRPI
jgi:hypothetical protein